MTDAPFTPLQREVLKGYLPAMQRMHNGEPLRFQIHGEALLTAPIEPEPKPVSAWPATILLLTLIVGVFWLIGKVVS